MHKQWLMSLVGVAGVTLMLCACDPIGPDKPKNPPQEVSQMFGDIEHIIKTDKTWYDMGDSVVLERLFVNHGDSTVEVVTSVMPEFVVSIERNDTTVFINPIVVMHAFSKTIFPGGSTRLNPWGMADSNPDKPLVWDMQRDSYKEIVPGTYQIISGIPSFDRPMTLRVDIEVRD